MNGDRMRKTKRNPTAAAAVENRPGERDRTQPESPIVETNRPIPRMNSRDGNLCERSNEVTLSDSDPLPMAAADASSDHPRVSNREKCRRQGSESYRPVARTPGDGPGEDHAKEGEREAAEDSRG
jgi:hypothetical protein